MERKRLVLKDSDQQGRVEAVVATLNVKDHDGDVILPGAFEDGQQVRISAYNHASWGDSLPVGKGTVHEQDQEAIFQGEFFLGTTLGKDTYEVVKELGELGEWSFGFDIRPGAEKRGEHQGERVRFIGPLDDGTPGIDTHEVSPVLLGAGIGTRTLAVKGQGGAQKQRNVAQWLESLIHMHATTMADDMAAEGHLTRDERIAISGALGRALESFNRTIAQEAPQLAERDPYEQADDSQEEMILLHGRSGDCAFCGQKRGPLRLSEEIEAATMVLSKTTARISEVMALRTEQGKSLGGPTKDRLGSLDEACKALRDVVTGAESDNTETTAAARALVTAAFATLPKETDA